ncbi:MULTISPECIES: hypothetical protein [unclassified Streptomyces]|uniref:hypothetical protein n=1 Tax=Streptomyces TaxID=1883 RepID=UPI0001C1997E|nr:MULTISPECIES: hypothetical protein [unclassified Streptomyces]AEN10536.1 conserved hypothetical protein [Streptomyces sp. SirexAA-E]MYR70075.1 hypothetical protein [Streptomyces sp. SID4939]MYS03084.1 hypothetical protein [Streptomyces sp. SID4940]MYT62275.1 hypothetical protein [Streptomyces sp. SID8357]MYT83929.1 hypothetical protein [Streptomyces sp. SID8360]
MSTAPAPGPRDPEPPQSQERPSQDSGPRPALVFDDPLDRQSADDTDQAWGERAPVGGGAADLARFLDEKPPHHI